MKRAGQVHAFTCQAPVKSNRNSVLPYLPDHALWPDKLAGRARAIATVKLVS
jgi:hypothetical protein